MKKLIIKIKLEVILFLIESFRTIEDIEELHRQLMLKEIDDLCSDH